MADLDDGTVDEVCVGHGSPLIMGNGAEGDRSEAACLLGPRHPIGAQGFGLLIFSPSTPVVGSHQQKAVTTCRYVGCRADAGVAAGSMRATEVARTLCLRGVATPVAGDSGCPVVAVRTTETDYGEAGVGGVVDGVGEGRAHLDVGVHVLQGDGGADDRVDRQDTASLAS